MEYETAKGIRYENELLTIERAGDKLQPIYEAFTNAWEAIHEKFDGDLSKGSINIKIYATKDRFVVKEPNICDFDRISITDNGIGLNGKNYERLVCLRDDSKNMSNKGTGRVQFLHYFEETTIESTYESESKEIKTIKVTLSKSKEFLSNNAILRKDDSCEQVSQTPMTTVTFRKPLYSKKEKDEIDNDKEKDFYAEISVRELKENIIRHFLWRLCYNKEKLPKISIQRYIDDKLVEEEEIFPVNIPDPKKEGKVRVKYSKLNNRNEIIKIDNKEEEFDLRSFVLPEETLEGNAIYLVSKGETACSLKLKSLGEEEIIEGNRYMFLLSGEYIDKHDSDARGNIKLVSAKEFKDKYKDSVLGEEIVLSNDIERETNDTIVKLHGEIEEKVSQRNDNIDRLKNMFLLNDKTVEAIRSKVKITDSPKEILKEFYKTEAEIKAEQDAKIEHQMEELEKLSPDDKDYQEKLQAKANEFVKTVPLQNRTVLSQYVARRKLVLEIFDKILEKFKSGGKIKESILHNLIFRRNSENSSPESSDLWLINEEYIYFDGTSDRKFDDIVLNKENLFKPDKELTSEERSYKCRPENDVGNKKPDIFLFPNEGKCIIIELKAPDVKVSDHIEQINTYASLIHNLSKEKYRFNTYYGYLIGENINVDDVQDANSYFQPADTLNYMFRPYYRIIGKFGRGDGSLYTEIIKYSDLLKRAGRRNEMFINKLLYGDANPPPAPNAR